MNRKNVNNIERRHILILYLFLDPDVVFDTDLYQLSSYIPSSETVTFFVSEFGYNPVTVENKLAQISEKLVVGKVFKLWHKGQKTVEELERLIRKKKKEDTYLKSRILRTVEETLIRKYK